MGGVLFPRKWLVVVVPLFCTKDNICGYSRTIVLLLDDYYFIIQECI